MKNLNFIKLILLFIVIVVVGTLVFNFTKETREMKKEENELIHREEQINEIANIYKENFKTIGKTKSAFAIEHEYNAENQDVRRDYYIFGEAGKSLIKIKEYEGTYENNTPILKKEIYIDLSKKVDGENYLYNGVTEVYIEDWSTKVIDNYEFKTPIEKVEEILNKRYDFENGDKEIALDLRNEIIVNKFDNLNFRWYGWKYEIKENEKNEYLSFDINNEERNLFLDFEKYENNERIEEISIHICEQKGNLDDVTVPEL